MLWHTTPKRYEHIWKHNFHGKILMLQPSQYFP
jgi:hypothetical protein